MTERRIDDHRVVLDAGACLGEGPHWDGERLWWVDIEGYRVHRTDCDSASDEVLKFGGTVGAVIPRAGGGFVVGLANGVGFYDEQYRKEAMVELEGDCDESRMNDAKCDPLGRLFTGTMVFGERRSALYRLDGDRAVTTIYTGVGTSNGLGWSPDGSLMYYIDTPTFRLDIADYDPVEGAVENRRPLVVFDPVHGVPDGLCVDSDGCIWVAMWQGWGVRRFDPEGVLMREVLLPVEKVTSCAFGGPNLDRLFVTSASCELTAPQRIAQPLAGALFELDPDCRGLPAVPFAG